MLFVGNSFTSVNNLPQMLTNMATADKAGPRIIAVCSCVDGRTLKEASADTHLFDLMNEVKWDYVVLQEQSQKASFSSLQRRQESDPYLASLAKTARATGATPLMYMTWGYRLGDTRNQAGDSFLAMEARLERGFNEQSAITGIRRVPVGPAWKRVNGNVQTLLWSSDDIHPSVAGSYIAASAFYESITQRPAFESSYTAGISGEQSVQLRQATHQVVEEYQKAS